MATTSFGPGPAARIVLAVTGAIATIIVLAILLVVFEANASNAVVAWLVDAGAMLAGPFEDLFRVGGPRLDLAVNWGLAAAAWSLGGRLAAGLLDRG